MLKELKKCNDKTTVRSVMEIYIKMKHVVYLEKKNSHENQRKLLYWHVSFTRRCKLKILMITLLWKKSNESSFCIKYLNSY